MRDRIACILALLLFGSAAAPAADTKAFDVDGVRLGLGESELSKLYPDGFSCRAYKWRLDADRICSAKKAAFAGVPAVYISFKLIGDRITNVQASIEYARFEALMARLERSIGELARRRRTPVQGAELDVIEWRAGGETLMLSTAHGCTRPGGCAITLHWSDEQTRTLIAKRKDYFESQRPVVGNLAPTEAQLAAGAALLDQLKRLREVDALVPRELRSKLSTVVESHIEDFGERKHERFKVVSSLPNIRVEHARYLLGSFDAPRGGQLDLPIDDHAACITEEMLAKTWGKGKRSVSIPHPGSGNYLAPKGHRGSIVSFTYETAPGIDAIFRFSFVHCASGVYIRDRSPRMK